MLLGYQIYTCTEYSAVQLCLAQVTVLHTSKLYASKNLIMHIIDNRLMSFEPPLLLMYIQDIHDIRNVLLEYLNFLWGLKFTVRWDKLKTKGLIYSLHNVLSFDIHRFIFTYLRLKRMQNCHICTGIIIRQCYTQAYHSEYPLHMHSLKFLLQNVGCKSKKCCFVWIFQKNIKYIVWRDNGASDWSNNSFDTCINNFFSGSAFLYCSD